MEETYEQLPRYSKKNSKVNPNKNRQSDPIRSCYNRRFMFRNQVDVEGPEPPSPEDPKVSRVVTYEAKIG